MPSKLTNLTKLLGDYLFYHINMDIFINLFRKYILKSILSIFCSYSSPQTCITLLVGGLYYVIHFVLNDQYMYVIYDNIVHGCLCFYDKRLSL